MIGASVFEMLPTLLQANSDGSRVLRKTLGGQDDPPAIPLGGHQQELPTSQNTLDQTTPSARLRPLCRGAEGATRPRVLCDHQTKHCVRDEGEEDCGEDGKDAEVPGLKLLLLINTFRQMQIIILFNLINDSVCL